MIRFYGVRKQYGVGIVALDDVTFEVPRGEFVFLTGASGAGKSTLLRLIYREELPTSGQILVAGRNVATMPEKKIPFLRRSIGIIFQDFRLIARKTVFENVAYLPRILGETPARQQELALEALERVGLGHRMSSYPRELSGGEQQRVAVARALIREPKLLLADEPTGNLDPDLSLEILRMFSEIQARGTTVLIATHDRSLIDRIGGRVLVLERGRLADDQRVTGTDEYRSSLPARLREAGEDQDEDQDEDEDERDPLDLAPDDDETVPEPPSSELPVQGEGADPMGAGASEALPSPTSEQAEVLEASEVEDAAAEPEARRGDPA